MPSRGRRTSLTQSPQSEAGTGGLERCGNCHYLHPKGLKLPQKACERSGLPVLPLPCLGAGATARAHLKPTGIQAVCRPWRLQGC